MSVCFCFWALLILWIRSASIIPHPFLTIFAIFQPQSHKNSCTYLHKQTFLFLERDREETDVAQNSLNALSLFSQPPARLSGSVRVVFVFQKLLQINICGTVFNILDLGKIVQNLYGLFYVQNRNNDFVYLKDFSCIHVIYIFQSFLFYLKILSVQITIFICFHLSTYLHLFAYLLFPSIYVCFNLSAHLHLCSSVHLSSSVFICQPIFICFHSSVYLSSSFPSIFISLCLFSFVSLSSSVFIYPLIFIRFHLPTFICFHPSTCLHLSAYFHLSAYLHLFSPIFICLHISTCVLNCLSLFVCFHLSAYLYMCVKLSVPFRLFSFVCISLHVC